MQDAIVGFQSAPLWAQIGMVLFAAMAMVAVIEPSVRRRKYRRQFDAIARGLGQQPPAGRGLPVAFSVSVDSRAFEISHDLRTTSKGSSYRGPSGHLLITATQLAGNRWSMHQVDISKLGKLGSWLVSGKKLTGDAGFDARFLVVEDGLPARDGWLDATMRTEIARFLDQAPLSGPIWIRDGKLLLTMPNPWTGLDSQVLRQVLQRQSALASALDRAAGVRF